MLQTWKRTSTEVYGAGLLHGKARLCVVDVADRSLFVHSQLILCWVAAAGIQVNVIVVVHIPVSSTISSCSVLLVLGDGITMNDIIDNQ